MTIQTKTSSEDALRDVDKLSGVTKEGPVIVRNTGEEATVTLSTLVTLHLYDPWFAIMTDVIVRVDAVLSNNTLPSLIHR